MTTRRRRNHDLKDPNDTKSHDRVLICGAGISGSILAYWLAKQDLEIVVIERSKAEQKSGQGLEIEQPALQVIKAMPGILDKLEKVKTGEMGFALYDEWSRCLGAMGVDGGPSPTGALELMRGDMTEIFFKAADESPNVTYMFETTLTTLRQTEDKVVVQLQNRHTKESTTEEFDFVVGTDGQRSRTRDLVFGTPEEIKPYKPVGAYVAYFSIPKQPQDWPFSRACHFTNSRFIWIRPTNSEAVFSSVSFIHVVDEAPALRAANAAGDRKEQKRIWAAIYAGLGWEVPRVITDMMTTDNFYSEELMQVKLPSWSKGRTVLLGDSAWAPTPFTGQGNQLAIIGAYVLAQEMSRNRSTIAFDEYEKRLRKYVESSQEIPLKGYAPKLFMPKSKSGIWILRNVFRVMSFLLLVLSKLNLGRFFPEDQRTAEDAFDLEMEQS